MESELELRQAILTGNTTCFLEIHSKNPLLLHRLTISCSNDYPLHAAALLGHISLAKEILRLCPDVAKIPDSSGSFPLHLAAAKGCLEMVKLLVTDSPEMCGLLNNDGLCPVHLAVVKGWVDVVRELVERRASVAKVKTDKEETVLHLCLRNCQFEVLKMLMESVDEVDELANALDEYGNTILHLAVLHKHNKIVKYLLTTGKVDINAKNANGYTPLDVLTQSRRDVQDWDIGILLQEAGAVKATHFTTPPNTMEAPKDENNPPVQSFLCQCSNSGRKLNQGEWLSKKRDALMVVASLLAAMAFQAGVNPPGGVLQGDSPGNPSLKNAHRPGEAVVAYNYPETYKYYLGANTISLVASLSTILLLISALPFKQKTFVWILMGIMWLSITSMAVSYAYSIVAVTPKKDRTAVRRTLYVAIPVWCVVMALLFIGHTLRLIEKWLTKKGIDMWKCMRKWSGCSALREVDGNPNQNV